MLDFKDNRRNNYCSFDYHSYFIFRSKKICRKFEKKLVLILHFLINPIYHEDEERLAPSERLEIS